MQDVTQAKKTWQDILVHAIVVSDRDALSGPFSLLKNGQICSHFCIPRMSMSWCDNVNKPT